MPVQPQPPSTVPAPIPYQGAPGLSQGQPVLPQTQAPVPQNGHGFGYQGYAEHFHHSAHSHWGWCLAGLLILLLVGLIGYWLGHWMARRPAANAAAETTEATATPAASRAATAAAPPRDDVLLLVRQRYARGEISRKEFRRICADLGVWP